MADIERFLSSGPGVQLEQFIAALGYSVSGKSVSDIAAEVERARGKGQSSNSWSRREAGCIALMLLMTDAEAKAL